MKKFIAVILALLLTSLGICEALPLPGTKIDDVKYTNVSVYINGVPIPAINIGGSIAVFVADLKYYGFDASWDEGAKTIFLTRNFKKAITPVKLPVYKNTAVGAAVGVIKYSQTKTYIVSDLFYKYVSSFNINGSTAIALEELKAFGSMVWSDKERSIRIKLDEAQADNPLAVKIKAAERFTVKNIGNVHLQQVTASRIQYNKATKKIEIKSEPIYEAEKGRESYDYYYAAPDSNTICLGRVIESVTYKDDSMEINPNYDKQKAYLSLQGTINRLLYLDSKYAEAEKRELANEYKANNYIPLKFTKTWVTLSGTNTPQARVEVKNLTQKTVDAFEFYIYCYDKNGRVSIHPAYKTNRYSAMYQSADKSEYIMPANIKGGDFYWTLDGYEKTAQIKVMLKSVHFTDGTVWKVK